MFFCFQVCSEFVKENSTLTFPDNGPGKLWKFGFMKVCFRIFWQKVFVGKLFLGSTKIFFFWKKWRNNQIFHFTKKTLFCSFLACKDFFAVFKMSFPTNNFHPKVNKKLQVLSENKTWPGPLLPCTLEGTARSFKS